MSKCIFCEIASGQIPVTSVYEDDEILVFLDHEPIRPGHLLILTKTHYPYFDDVPPDLLGRVCRLGQRLATIQRAALGVDRAGMMFSGNDIAHCHAHIVPLHTNTDLTSAQYFAGSHLEFQRCPRASDAALRQMQETISTMLGALR